MEDFIEIIFYIAILVFSGIGSLLKNKKKQQKPISEPNLEKCPAESESEEVVGEVDTSKDEEDNELIRMLREAAVAEAQQRAKEVLELQQREEEARQKAIAERNKKAELLRIEKEKELAKQQTKIQNENLEVSNSENNSVFDLNLSDVDEARRAFIASEIFNKIYC